MVRGKGEGSIYQRSDGRWVAQIEAGRSPAGRRRYARGVRRTRKDAQKALKEVQRAAVLLLDQGVPLEVVSAVLGHANLSITSDVYGRVTTDAKRRALAKLDG
jgi:integrase